MAGVVAASSLLNRQFRMGLLQLTVSMDKQDNVKRAINSIKKAVGLGCKVIALPECFNCPYGTQYFREYAESIPDGSTCLALSQVAKEHSIYLIGGTIPELFQDKIYNSCTAWGPEGELLALHRKVHLFDIDIPGGIRFKESDAISAGDRFTTFNMDGCKIGLGICYDIRFGEMAQLYRQQGCDMIVYPGAFNMKTGPLHWEVLLRARAIDNQLYVAGVAPAQVQDASYVSYGHSMIIDPWGTILKSTTYQESLLYADIDLQVVNEVRQQIPVFDQRRESMYEIVDKTTP